MSITLGSYTNLPNTLKDDGCVDEEVQASRQWIMCDGSLAKHFQAGRWRWTLRWDIASSVYADLVAAYEAARGTAKTFKPPDTSSTWTVVASNWHKTAYSIAGGAIRYKVDFVVEEITV